MLSSSIRLIVSANHRTRFLNSPPLNPPIKSISAARIFTSDSKSPLIAMSSVDRTSDSDSRGEIVENRASRMKAKLERELEPLELVIEDVSYQHAGHAGMKGRRIDEETHFNVKIVSKGFQGMNLVKRHRLVYDLLKEELDSGLHALSIVSKTPSESNR